MDKVKEILDQLRLCKYTDELGHSLFGNHSFIELVALGKRATGRPVLDGEEECLVCHKYPGICAGKEAVYGLSEEERKRHCAKWEVLP